ncbi:hypothetical protein OTSANNIE_1644 [Anaplasma phagocytophilum str. Annie]|nr:hypothetical protein OTSANNIE_1644 [Anaplasma phagocytophilum str. Annie]
MLIIMFSGEYQDGGVATLLSQQCVALMYWQFAYHMSSLQVYSHTECLACNRGTLSIS